MRANLPCWMSEKEIVQNSREKALTPRLKRRD
jgi:hypothetical protein